jgi:hypothetical protein
MRGYATIDGRFVPGVNAIAPVLNWQREAQTVMTPTTGDPQRSQSRALQRVPP